MDSNDPLNVYVALKRIEIDLPVLLEENARDEVLRRLAISAQQLKQESDPKTRKLIVADIRQILWMHEQAKKRFTEELRAQAVIVNNLHDSLVHVLPSTTFERQKLDHALLELLSHIAWQSSPESDPVDSGETHRAISISPGGFNAKSIKFSNLRLSVVDLLKLAGGTLGAGVAVLNSSHPYLIMFTALALAATFVEASTKELSEQDASVFWGFVVASRDNPERISEENATFETTNDERAGYGFEAISEKQFKVSLIALTRLGVIKRVNGSGNQWKIIEQYHVRD
ncbi:MAG: hypothetical protein IPO91_03180 [Chloroflexi bacterium]|nr:hypothetical protein [Chloroflexota bacterium]